MQARLERSGAEINSGVAAVHQFVIPELAQSLRNIGIESFQIGGVQRKPLFTATEFRNTF